MKALRLPLYLDMLIMMKILSRVRLLVMTLVWMVRRSGVARQDVNLSVVIHLQLPVLGIATKLLISKTSTSLPW